MNYKNYHVLQNDIADCGICCLLTIIRFYKGNESLEYLRGLSGTNVQGTTLLGLYQCVKNVGFDTEACRSDINSLIEHAAPVILHVEIQDQKTHYIVCFGYDKKKEHFIISDPEKGIYYLSKSDLQRYWKSNLCLTLTPNSTFVRKEKRKEVQRIKKFILKDRLPLTFSFLLGIGIAFLGLTMSLFSQKLIDEILPLQDILKLILGIILLAFFLLLRTGLLYLRENVLNMQARDFNNRLISLFYTRILHLPKFFFDTRKIGELVARLNDTSRIQRVLQSLVRASLIDILIIIVSIPFLFYFSIWIGLTFIFFIPIYLLIVYQYKDSIIRVQNEVMECYAINESNYISTINGITAIKNLNAESQFIKINAAIFGAYQNKIFDLGKINIKLSFIVGIVNTLYSISILSLCCYEVFNKSLTIGDMVAILGISTSLITPIMNLSVLYIPINEARIAYERMSNFISIPQQKNSDNKLFIDNIEKVSFKKLSFGFAGKSLLLNNLELEIAKGEFVALMGKIGSGKSTIAHILSGDYIWNDGDILINDTISLNLVKPKCWKNLIGIVPQEVPIFNGSLLFNIMMGKVPDINYLNSFLLQYGLVDFINSFPYGINTLVGESGINLSGGQKQIIGIIRALLNNPMLLILDEPTASLDIDSEVLIFNIIKKIKNATMIFCIMHRTNAFSSIIDKVYIIENKTVTKINNLT